MKSQYGYQSQDLSTGEIPHIHNKKSNLVLTCGFLLSELILYILILTTGGSLLVYSSYISIVLCFLFSLIRSKSGDRFLISGLFCTVMADYHLVICSPIQQLEGMVWFLIAQLLYAVTLHKRSGNTVFIWSRGILTLLAAIIAVIVLTEKTDALALVSICYYANLIMNIVTAFSIFPDNPLLPIGFVLFLCCDTVIGLQAACGTYLAISESSLLYRIIFMDFHLSWFFYLPSQVLIALSCSHFDKKYTFAPSPYCSFKNR